MRDWYTFQGPAKSYKGNNWSNTAHFHTVRNITPTREQALHPSASAQESSRARRDGEFLLFRTLRMVPRHPGTSFQRGESVGRDGCGWMSLDGVLGPWWEFDVDDGLRGGWAARADYFGDHGAATLLCQCLWRDTDLAALFFPDRLKVCYFHEHRYWMAYLTYPPRYLVFRVRQ